MPKLGFYCITTVESMSSSFNILFCVSYHGCLLVCTRHLCPEFDGKNIVRIKIVFKRISIIQFISKFFTKMHSLVYHILNLVASKLSLYILICGLSVYFILFICRWNLRVRYGNNKSVRPLSPHVDNNENNHD